jgi:hypothetical protein
MVEDPRDLVRAEGDALAEAVDRVDQPFGMGCVHAGDHHLAEIAVAIVPILRRQGVGGEPAGHHPHRPLRTDRPGDPQHLQLARAVEPVAGLDLQRGDALGDQRVDPGQRRGQQRLLVRRARGADARKDAAAFPGDLLVACAFQPHLELARPVAAEDDVAVAVDQPRRDHPPSEVAARRAREGRRQIPRRPDPGDSIAVDRQSALLDQVVTA